jgi:hypothetical protein
MSFSRWQDTDGLSYSLLERYYLAAMVLVWAIHLAHHVELRRLLCLLNKVTYRQLGILCDTTSISVRVYMSHGLQ